MRFASLLLCVSLSSTGAFAMRASAPASDAATLDTPFTVQRETQVPGKVLKPGAYTLVIKDHLTDRAIIQVKKDDGKVESTFLGVFHSGIQSTGATGPIALPTEKGHEALRGFKFPGGGTIEFVYPKAEAAKLATKSPEQVLAIDPASDNLHTTGKNLSTEDAQIVTLWSLQASKVSTGQPGISAKKFVAPPAENTNTQVAAAPAPAPRAEVPVLATRSAAPAPSPAPSTSAVAATAKRPAPPAAAQVASAPRRPKLAALPHTASNLPLLLLISLVSFAAASITRVTRTWSQSRATR